MRSGAWIALAIVFVLPLACRTPTVVRDGRAVPVDLAVQADLATARTALEAGNARAANSQLERLVAEAPYARRIDEVLFLLGETYVALERPEAAITSYRRSLRQNPRGSWAALAHLRLAGLYRESERPELARGMLERAPFDRADTQVRVRLYEMLAELAVEAGHDAEAVRWLAYQRRDLVDETRIARLETRVDELLLADRLAETELERLAGRVPRGPVHDRLLLELARRAIDAGDPDAARHWLARLPDRLRPDEEARRDAISRRLDRDLVGLGAPIGVALPLTGPYRGYGWSALQGIVLGLGIYDDPPSGLRLEVRDTTGDPERAARAVRELNDSGAVAVLGPLRSSTTAAAAEAAQQGGIPLLAFAQREDLPLLGAWVFRLGVTRTDQVRVLVRYAVEEGGARRFAILYPRDDYGSTYKNLFWDEVEEAGGEVVGSEAYEPDAVDVQAPVRRLVGLEYLTNEERARIEERDRLRRRPGANAERLADPELAELPPYVDFDALFIPETAQRVGLILPQLRFYDIRSALLLGPSDWNDRALVEIAGEDAEGSVFSDVFFPDSDFPFVQEFVSEYHAAFGEDPDALAAEGYDAASMIRDVLTGESRVSRAGVRNAVLRIREFPGVSGVTTFDEAGGSRKNLYLLTVRRGEIAQLDQMP